jgi:hypothetical protein
MEMKTLGRKYENALQVLNRIQKFFGADLIGSFLLVPIGLDVDLINDIDIAINEKDFFKVKTYLEDGGYKETKDSYTQRGYAAFIGSRIFVKENEYSVHLSFKYSNFTVKSIEEIIGEKFVRKTESDIKQLQYLLDKK